MANSHVNFSKKRILYNILDYFNIFYGSNKYWIFYRKENKMKIRNKELEEHIKNDVPHGAFDAPSKSYLRQKEKQELKAIQQAYNFDTRFEYYSEAQRN